jgi:outer membrane cobalamin receptor
LDRRSETQRRADAHVFERNSGRKARDPDVIAIGAAVDIDTRGKVGQLAAVACEGARANQHSASLDGVRIGRADVGCAMESL